MFLSRVSVFILTFSLITACSSKKVEEKEPSVELTDEFEVTDGELSVDQAGDSEMTTEEVAEVAPKSEETTTIIPAEENTPAETSTVTQSVTDQTTTETSVASTTDQVTRDGNLGYYTVQANETLMMVAFKIYGDYTKWREISALNKDQIPDGQSIHQGMKLAYNQEGSGFSWNPEGEPYLIKWGNTLGTISNSVYGTKDLWKDLWKHNKPLIRNPNRIYAGFTLFYIPRDKVASAQ